MKHKPKISTKEIFFNNLVKALLSVSPKKKKKDRGKHSKKEKVTIKTISSSEDICY